MQNGLQAEIAMNILILVVAAGPETATAYRFPTLIFMR
jgi:hypothetical protein